MSHHLQAIYPIVPLFKATRILIQFNMLSFHFLLTFSNICCGYPVDQLILQNQTYVLVSNVAHTLPFATCFASRYRNIVCCTPKSLNLSQVRLKCRSRCRSSKRFTSTAGCCQWEVHPPLHFHHHPETELDIDRFKLVMSAFAAHLQALISAADDISTDREKRAVDEWTRLACILNLTICSLN